MLAVIECLGSPIGHCMLFDTFEGALTYAAEIAIENCIEEEDDEHYNKSRRDNDIQAVMETLENDFEYFGEGMNSDYSVHIMETQI